MGQYHSNSDEISSRQNTGKSSKKKKNIKNDNTSWPSRVVFHFAFTGNVGEFDIKKLMQCTH